MRNSTEESLKVYIKKDWHVFPLGAKSKEPDGVKWKETKATLSNSSTLFSGDQNIGIALGEASGGLVDLDFDQPEAAAMGTRIFHELPAFGRNSSLNSHRVAVCADAGKTSQYGLTKEEASALGLPDASKLMILEVRSNGAYTMFPPSAHPSGEIVKWNNGIPSEFPQMAWDHIVKKAGIVAALSVVLRAYPKQAGQRDSICMALAGTLLRTGMPPENVDDMVVYIATCAGDEEAEKRRKAETTAEKIAAGENVTGLTKLCELLGIEKLKPKLHKWFYGNPFVKGPDDHVAELNEKFFVIASEGGKCRVGYFEEQFFEKKQVRRVLVFQSFPDFKNRMMHIKIEIGVTQDGNPIIKPLGHFWLDSQMRRQHDRVVFVPGGQAGPDDLNLWQGFAFEAKQGAWRYMQRHIWCILAKRDKEAFRYILKWAAWSVQNPGDPAEVALVFRGGKGTGKGTFCRWIKTLFGQHGLQIFSSKHISGRFNSHLRDCVLLFADEAIAPNNKEAESILKGMLTEPSIPIEGKGRDVIQAPNHLHVMMASNSEWVVPASADERRFAIFDISDEVKQNEEWFKLLNKEMENGGAEAMLHFLLNIDLKGWHPRQDIPANDALNDQRIQSLEGMDRIWFDYLHGGEAPGDKRGKKLFVATTVFAEEAKVSATAAGRYLKAMGGEHDRATRPSGWIMPPLREAREQWNKSRFNIEWDDNDEWGPYEPPF